MAAREVERGWESGGGGEGVRVDVFGCAKIELGSGVIGFGGIGVRYLGCWLALAAAAVTMMESLWESHYRFEIGSFSLNWSH